ncbi:MAG: CHAP domain-containing protein [Candidatus Eremiobacteraeota bacterium]|nr:CHAP domain-containing protein [Candidatus Eremiobacteraeota bacterium]
MNFLGGAALDRLNPTASLNGLAPMSNGLMNSTGVDPMLQMLMQMLMGLMGNSASASGLLGTDPSQSLSDMVGGMGGSGGGGGFGGGGGNGGGGGGSIGGGGGGGGGGSARTSGGGGGGGSSYSGPVPDRGPVAPGTAALLDDAGKMVGLNERSDTKEIMKITGESGINPATTPWCAAFAINMMKDHGVLDTTGLSNPNYTPTIKSWAQDKKIWGESGKYTPKPGDAIMFDWEHDGKVDHIGIVESVKNGKVYTIEGNSSDSVKRNSYSLGDNVIDGYVVSKDASGGKDAKGKDETPKAKAPDAPRAKEPEPKAKPAPATPKPKTVEV